MGSRRLLMSSTTSKNRGRDTRRWHWSWVTWQVSDMGRFLHIQDYTVTPLGASHRKPRIPGSPHSLHPEGPTQGSTHRGCTAREADPLGGCNQKSFVGGLPISGSHTQVARLGNVLGRATRSWLSMQGAASLGFLDNLRRPYTQGLRPNGPMFGRSHMQVPSGEHRMGVSTHW